MTNLFDVTHKLAFVTGSSRGIGLALANGLAAAGATVVLHGRDSGALANAQQKVAENTGTEPAVVAFDITDAAAVEAGVGELVSAHGVPDILVNNAGVQKRGPFHEFDPADWDTVIATNLSAAFYVSRQVAAAMVPRRVRQDHQHRVGDDPARSRDHRTVRRLQGRRGPADQGDGG